MNPQADFSGFSRIGDAYIRGRRYADERNDKAMDDILKKDDRERREFEDNRRANRERERMMIDLGEDVTLTPEGEIDVQTSLAKRKQRQDADVLAASAGELEGLGMEQPIPEELRNLPAYRAGKARALAKRTYDRDRAEMDQAIERIRQEGYTRRAQIGADSRIDAALLKPTKTGNEIEVEEEDFATGAKTKRRFNSPEEFRAYQAEKGGNAPAELTPLEQAMKDFEAAQAEGAGVRLVEKKGGDVSVERTSTRPDNPAIVRRRLEQLGTRKGGTNAPTRVINFKDLGISR